MTKDDIMRLAREATRVIEPDDPDYRQEIFDKEKFANLVAAAEREECAKMCDDETLRCEAAAERAESDEVSAIRSTAWKISVCAAAIRARTTP